MKFFVKLFLSAFLVFSVPFSVGAQDDVVVTKQYDDGGMYEGTFKNGLQHGIGTYRLPNGYEYSGEWVDGEILGVGVAKFPNGSVYEAIVAYSVSFQFSPVVTTKTVKRLL